jgi:lysyl-tRNA synthetase class I
MRPAVDFFKVERMTIMYEANKQKVCEACATSKKQDNSNPFMPLCQKCTKDNLYLLN